MSRNFGKVLKYSRALDGRSQLELALDAGVSARHLSFLESGRAEPGRDVVAKLAATLDVSATTRNALFVAAGFSPIPGAAAATPSNRLLLERMLLHLEPFPSALTDSQGNILATNTGMRALHATLSGVVRDLPPSAVELALGPRGLGPYLKNRDVLERRFAHCRALEGLIAGAAVEDSPAQDDTHAPAEMHFDSPFGPLTFGLAEAIQGHPLHGSKDAFRTYCMVPRSPETEAAMSAMIARHKSASAA